MSRKGPIAKRRIENDARFDSYKVAKFINNVMMHGKKGLAERIVYSAMDDAAAKSGKEPLELFEEALENVAPLLEVRARRVGGATYQVPVEVRPERKLSLSMRWLLAAARARNNRTMAEKLSAELADAAAGIGAAVKKKEDTHRMAEANKAFAHYRW